MLNNWFRFITCEKTILLSIHTSLHNFFTLYSECNQIKRKKKIIEYVEGFAYVMYRSFYQNCTFVITIRVVWPVYNKIVSSRTGFLKAVVVGWALLWLVSICTCFLSWNVWHIISLDLKALNSPLLHLASCKYVLVNVLHEHLYQSIGPYNIESFRNYHSTRFVDRKCVFRQQKSIIELCTSICVTSVFT